MDQLYFMAEAGNASLLSALGIDVRLLLLQAGAFLVLVFILGKFAYPTILKSLEQRRATLEKGLRDAKKAESDLAGVEQKVNEIIHAARREASDIVSHSQQEATSLVEAAETRASKRAETIVAEARAQMSSELSTAREALKKDTAELVAKATERIIKEKVDAHKDASLIASALKEAK